MVENKALTKVVIIGNLDVGKTTLLNSYCGDSNANQSTLSQDQRKMEEKVGPTTVTLQLWDTAGQEKYNSIGFAFYRGANCCILVYDITDETSFERLNTWKTNFVDAANPSNPEDFPYIVVGQKLDRAAERKVSEDQAREWCKAQNIKHYFETSAKEGTNVDAVFKAAAKMAADENSGNGLLEMKPMGNMMSASIRMSVAGDKAATQAKVEQKKKKKCC